MPHLHSLLLALLYSIGCARHHDAERLQGHRGRPPMGIGSLPVRLGVQRAAQAACVLMIVPQVVVVAAAAGLGRTPWHAGGVAALVALQGAHDAALPGRSPRAQALWYSGFGVPVFVAGMMVSAFALRGLQGVA
jgi:chlorophyll synthase